MMARTVRRRGEAVELTPKPELRKEVWGYGNPDVNTRTF